MVHVIMSNIIKVNDIMKMQNKQAKKFINLPHQGIILGLNFWDKFYAFMFFLK